jgi:hypothetical protein
VNVANLKGEVPLAEKPQSRNRGVRDAVLVIVAAALVMSPSYLARIELNQFNFQLPMIAVSSLALFVIGVFLLLRVMKD